MRDHLSFYLNGELRVLRDINPAQTLLRYLRDDEGLTGTKEGCAEGDCGACTVMVSALDQHGAVERRAVNACILFLPSLEGKCLTTVEALQNEDGAPHPVQRAMVDHHGSQCGFCTPGIVMSLYTAYRNKSALDRASANDVLAGNLCRCTGYGPILSAAAALGEVSEPEEDIKATDLEASQLRALDHGELVAQTGGARSYYSPVCIDVLARLYAEHPDATLIAGATDAGLMVTKEHKDLGAAIFLNRVKALQTIKVEGARLTIGAGVSYTGAMDVLTGRYPDFGELIRRIGAVQVRNVGTIGGNIANGSPIGDTPPALIALGAQLALRKGADRRVLALEDFFISYGRQDLRPGEFVEAITIPLTADASALRCYKISKRFDQDISAVCGCFNIQVENGAVASARIAFGGMAQTPKRAVQAEAMLAGAPWTRQTVAKAAALFEHDFQPITDMRASAEYRMITAKNLLLKYFLETQHPLASTRLTGYGSAIA